MRAMYRERSILHFNVADFAVAVERVTDTTLKNRPLIVAPLQAARAVVYDMSEEAYQNGVRKGMVLSQAARRCKEALILPPRFDVYKRAMSGFLQRVQRFSPLIEHGISDGHFFVDVTGTHRLFGPAPDIGWKVRKEVRADLGIDPIWALSSNKLVAKVASRVVKPVGEYIVAAGEEEEFLAPLSISLLPGIGSEEMKSLYDFNIYTIGQLAGLSSRELMVPFGNRSEFLYQISRGIDKETVVREKLTDISICCEHYFDNDTNDIDEVRSVVAALAGRAGMELRKKKKAARRVAVKLIYSDGGITTRQASRKRGSADDSVLKEMGMLALRRAWGRRTRLRSCFLVCDRLHQRSPQRSLFEEPNLIAQKKNNLLKAMDTVRTRFGNDSLQLGCRVQNGSSSVQALQ